MGDRTAISWTEATWSPFRGCSRISEGCRNCYAERIAERFSGPGQAFEGFAERGRGWTRKVELQLDQLAVPLRWKRGRRIFVSSMTDVFHESISNEEIAAVFGIMAAAPQHTFQVLTKRAKRMREWFEWVESTGYHPGHVLATALEDVSKLDDSADPCLVDARWLIGLINGVKGFAAGPYTEDAPNNSSRWPLPNVWLGVSVENQDAADERIPEQLATPAAVHFLSCEPLIGQVDLNRPRCDYPHHSEMWGLADDEATPWCSECDSERSYYHWLHLDGGIDWVIVGCESGPGARPCEVAWLRQLRDQCEAAGVAFWLKQARYRDGEYTITNRRPVPIIEGRIGELIPVIGFGPGSTRKGGGVIELPYLDGVQHAAFPEVHDGVKHEEI